MALPGRKYSAGSEYRYGFNGKENDQENDNRQDYGLRIYDTRLAKFLSVDPLSQSYPWYSPFEFAGNNPIFFVDLNGGQEGVSTTIKTNFGNVTLIKPPDGYTLQQILDELKKPLKPKPPTPVESPFALSRLWLTVTLVFTPLSIGDEMTPMEYKFLEQRSKILNAKPEDLQIITTDPSTLSDEYLTQVRQRELNGTATEQDKLYRSEVQKRIIGANDEHIINDAHVPWKKEYNWNKGVLPDNVEQLWNKRSYYDEKNQEWWTVEGKGKDAVYHRFSGKNTNGKFHWSGSSNGKNKGGKPVELKDPQIPKELLKKTRKKEEE